MQIIISKFFTYFVVFLLLISASLVKAETQRTKISHELPHLQGDITLNGSLDEPVWKNALKINLNYETSPGENTKPPVETEVFLFEDGVNLYVGFNALDPNPEQIRDYLTDRDNVWDSDFVGIKFDTFNESRKAFQFFVNALGVQADATQEDFRGDDSNWDVIWDSAGQVTETGYIVEIAIPFDAIRFPSKQGSQIWPFELTRFYPRSQRHRIANTPVDRDISCNICQFDYLVGLEDIKPSQNLTLIPTLVVARADERPIDAASWQNGDVDSEIGLDVRWGITQDTVVNATINPDFSQVEADAAQIDINNPFSLFLTEKRPFFLDGADYFTSPRNLFYSRNINQPDFGLKVTGQTEGHSYGVISVDDNQTNILIPGRLRSDIANLSLIDSQNTIARYSYNLGNKNNIGFYHTNRTGTDYENTVNAFDGKYWFDQYHSITVQYISTETDNPEDIVNEFDLNPNQQGDAFTVNFRHDSRNWWGYVNYIEFDKGFRADLGFNSQVDFDKKIIGLGHRWYFDSKKNWWNQISLGGDWDETYDSAGILLEEEIQADIWLHGKMQSNIGFGVVARDKVWEGEDNNEFARRYFGEQFYFLNGNIEPISGLNLSLRFNWGDRINFDQGELGQQFIVEPGINWQINQNWKTNFSVEKIDFKNNGAQIFTAKATNLRVAYQMNIRSFLRFTLQEFDLQTDELEKNQSIQLLYSYKINPQTLFFAGYSDAGFRDNTLSTIRTTDRSVFMKFSYAWQL